MNKILFVIIVFGINFSFSHSLSGTIEINGLSRDYEIKLIQNKFQISKKGFCPCCNSSTVFITNHAWFRDHYVCSNCKSKVRDRQIYKLLNKQNFDSDNIVCLEFSPNIHNFLKNRTKNYLASCYFPDKRLGRKFSGIQNEDIQKLTFKDNSFDLIIHEDVFEHIFDPISAIQEIYRVLKVHGKCIFCFPIFERDKSIQRCKLENGTIIDILPKDFHGSPIGNRKSLVVYEYGRDIIEKMKKKLGDKVKFTHIKNVDENMGIIGKFLDVFMIEKLA